MDYKNEKKNCEAFIVDTVKKLPDKDKQRVADMLLGMLLALPGVETPPHNTTTA